MWLLFNTLTLLSIYFQVRWAKKKGVHFPNAQVLSKILYRSAIIGGIPLLLMNDVQWGWRIFWFILYLIFMKILIKLLQKYMMNNHGLRSCKE